MMASFAGTTQKCKACEKAVYLVDQLTADNKIYHKSCFRCYHCKGTLKVRSRFFFSSYFRIHLEQAQVHDLNLSFLCMCMYDYAFDFDHHMLLFIIYK